MRMKLSPHWLTVTLLFGCDFFSTREIIPKPADIQVLNGLLNVGDTLVFKVVESLRDSGAVVDKQVLSTRKLIFTFGGDSITGTDTLKKVLIKLVEAPSQTLIEQGVRLLRISSSGLILENTINNGGARFFPFKLAAPAITNTNANTSADTNAYIALPAVFVEGWSLDQTLGVLTVHRELRVSDTLAYHGHSEVTWQVAETVMGVQSELVKGKYWYGASGLLKAEQHWNKFDWRSSSAVSLGKVELVRKLERL